MNELIKSILILVKSIFDDEKEKNENRNINLANIFTHVFHIEQENLSLRVLFDWSARPYDDDRDLYRYKLIVVPEDWDPNKYISLMYDIKKSYSITSAYIKIRVNHVNVRMKICSNIYIMYLKVLEKNAGFKLGKAYNAPSRYRF